MIFHWETRRVASSIISSANNFYECLTYMSMPHSLRILGIIRNFNEILRGWELGDWKWSYFSSTTFLAKHITRSTDMWYPLTPRLWISGLVAFLETVLPVVGWLSSDEFQSRDCQTMFVIYGKLTFIILTANIPVYSLRVSKGRSKNVYVSITRMLWLVHCSTSIKYL